MGRCRQADSGASTAAAAAARNTRRIRPTSGTGVSSPTMIQIRMIKLPALLLLAMPAFAAEIELRYAALERILADQLFTQEGRHYVRGSRTTKCQFAYLETPHIDSDAGRLRIAARFSGRSALE